MHFPRWAACACVALASVPVSSAEAQKQGNSPKLQKKLEAMAARLTNEEIGPVRAHSAVVGDHMLTIRFEPMQGVDGALALKNMRETSWDRALCTNKDALEFINGEGVTVRIALSRPGLETETITDVTAASCAREASVDPTLSRVIDGVTFAPQPTKEQALARVQAYINANFFDPGAAQVSCGDPTPPAWVKPMLQRRRYGYLIQCSINGKNRFGGYVGFQTFTFRMNADDFETIDVSSVTMGRMDGAK